MKKFAKNFYFFSSKKLYDKKCGFFLEKYCRNVLMMQKFLIKFIDFAFVFTVWGIAIPLSFFMRKNQLFCIMGTF